MNKKKVFSVCLVFCLMAALFAGCGGNGNRSDSGQKEPSSVNETKDEAEDEETIEKPDGISANVVHIAIQPSAAFIPLFVCKNEKWIEQALEPYGVEVVWNNFAAGPPMNESLADGTSDFGVIGDVPVVSGIYNSGKTELIAISAQAARSYAILVPPDSKVKTAADLAGGTVATVVGSTSHNMIDKFMRTGGYTIDDVNLISITTGEAGDLLRSGEVDAISLWEPNVTRLVDSKLGKVIALGPDCGLAGTNGIVANTRFVEKNPLIAKIIMEQYYRAAQSLDMLSDEQWGDVGSDLSVLTDQVKKIAKKFDYTVVITEEDLDALNDTIAFLVRIGNLPEEFDIRDYTDDTFVKDLGK